MRPGRVVVIAAAVFLAGCSGVPLLDDGGASTPTDEAPTVGPPAVDPPPGVLSLQVANPAELGRAHARAIENRSYVLTSNRTVRYEDGTLRSRMVTRVAVEEGPGFLVRISTAGPAAPVLLGRPPASAVYWSDGETYLRRLTREGETTHVETEPPGTWIGTRSFWTTSVPFGGRNNRPSTYYASVFSAVPTRVTGPTTVDGTATYRIENDGDRPFPDGSFPGRVESVHDVSLVALVDSDGLVRRLDLRYAGTVEGESVRVERRIRYSDVGSTTVGRPSWYEKAVAAGENGSSTSGR